jgi:hypothetical protein
MKPPEHNPNMAKQQQYGISSMTLNGMKCSHGPMSGSGSTDGEVTGNLFIKKEKPKIHFLDMCNLSMETGKAALSL